jgi:Fic family protein
MEYIKQKTIKGKKYYYFNYTLSGFSGKKRINLSKYVGQELPENVKELFLYFFENNVAVRAIIETSKGVKNYFPPNGVEIIEKNRFWYACLLHRFFKKDFTRFIRLFYILFVLNSNRAEGSRVTRPDIEKILKKNIVHPKTDLDKEIINSIEAINFSFLSKKMKWNVKSIKLIHKKLFHNINMEHYRPGQYRKELMIAGNDINGQNVFTAPPKEISREMKNLLKWFYKQLRTKQYPPILALEFHWRFEKIHPFYDGNGRVGRILLNALLVKNNFMPVIFFSQNYRAYCSAIAKAKSGYSKKLAKHFIEHIKKTRENIKKYEEFKGIIKSKSNIGKWEVNRSNIRIY